LPSSRGAPVATKDLSSICAAPTNRAEAVRFAYVTTSAVPPSNSKTAPGALCSRRE
jgi:hypothetical protein